MISQLDFVRIPIAGLRPPGSSSTARAAPDDHSQPEFWVRDLLRIWEPALGMPFAPQKNAHRPCTR